MGDEADDEHVHESPESILAQSTASQTKWAPIVMLGPLLPSVLAVVTIIVGDVVLQVSYSMTSH